MHWPGTTGKVEKLVDAHYLSLYRYGYRLTGSAPQAEDLAQETFCQAQLKLGQLRDEGRAKAWLFTILRNHYLRTLREANRMQPLSPEELNDLPERLAEPLPEIDPACLQRALDELPEVFRTPLILYYFEDFSYRDIAEHMDVPLGTVMSRLARAKSFLRTRLQPAMEPAILLAK